MGEREDMLSVADDAEAEARWEDAMSVRAEARRLWPTAPARMREVPWERGDWDGEFVSLDGCSNADFAHDDVAEVLAYGDSGGGWDGEAAGIVRLKDGRFVAWESDWGPTGSGFSRDAYGGKADIAFASTPGVALRYISERGRELLRW